MIDVRLTATGQRLEVDPSQPRIIRGTRNMLRLCVSFSPEWDGMAVAAVFRNGDAVPLEGGRCMVPNELCDRMSVHVRLVGKRGAEVYTTCWAAVRQGE